MDVFRPADDVQSAPLAEIDPGRVQQQLHRILSSELFLKSPQLSRFLRFCVDRVLLGRQDELKEQVLGTEVFRRSASFDPRVDPIVRVEARRLRARLDDYYAAEGRFDPLVIYFQRGDYVPRFAQASARDKSAGPALSARILVVEDERLVARDLENRLKGLGYSVVRTASTGEGAIKAAEETRPDLVLMDIALSGPMRGTEAARRIWQRWHIPVVYLTAFSDAVVLEDIRGAEPYGYVLKPFEARHLHGVLQLALSRRGREMGEATAAREQSRIDALLSAMETASIESWEWAVSDPQAPWPSAAQGARERLLPDCDDDPQQFISGIVPADRQRVCAAFERALRETSRVEVGYRRASGEGPAGFAVATGVAVREESGTTKLRGLEIRISPEVVQQTWQALALREVGQFATSVAGELRKSIDAVTGYLQLLEQRQQASDPLTRSVIDEMEHTLQPMRELLGKLQCAGSSGAGSLEWKPVPLDDVVDAVVLAMRDRLNEARAELTRTPLPLVRGDAAGLRGVFEALLANAVERRGEEPLRIHLSAERRDGDWSIEFRDNGQRADLDALPLCRQIIGSHGGTVESEAAGEGSIIRLVLPAVS